MAKLIRTTEVRILAGREFWELENSFEVIASEHEGNCVLFVNGKKNGKSAELVSKYLEAKGFEHSLGASIDSPCIVFPESQKMYAIELIEQWKW